MKKQNINKYIMRFQELFEYINFSQEALLKRFKQDNGQKFPEIGENGENFTAWLEEYDPTQKKKYVNWMISRYLQGGIKRLEDIPSKISDWLDTYDRLARTKKLKPEHKDIGRIKNDSQLADLIRVYADVETQSKSEKKSAEEQAMYDSKKAKLLYDDEEWKLVIPLTEEASCYFGKNTQWCTAAKNHSMFSHYNMDGPLIVMIHKPSGKRWQLHFESNQFMDATDSPVRLFELMSKAPEGIRKVLKSLGYYEHFKDGYSITKDGIKTYHNKWGQLHRKDGPAHISPLGTEKWYQNGNLHREGGPAVYNEKTGVEEWYYKGARNRDYEDGPAVITSSGVRKYYMFNNLHRTGAPAVISADGEEWAWYQNNEIHRDDGPAVCKNGNYYWYQKGKRHREDGPAAVMDSGRRLWILNDEIYGQKEPNEDVIHWKKEWPNEKIWPDGKPI